MMTALLELNNVSVSFYGFKAVQELSLSVKDGELRCLLGANGAGKSTTLDLICGKTKSTGGDIRFKGENITDLPEYRRARLGIGRKFQVPTVFKDLTVTENLEVARSKRCGVWQTLRRSGVRMDARVEEVATVVGLQDRMTAKAGHLSHGETQWLEIAMLLMQDSKLLLMDEPTAGMTMGETAKTSEILNGLKGRHTLIVVEHDMSFVREIAEKITVMHQGALLAEGTIAEVANNEQVRAAYLGSGGFGHA